MKLFTIRDEENRGKTGDKQPTRSRKGIILVGIIIVLVIGIGLYIFSSMMSGPGMTDAEREQAMAELAEWSKEIKQNTVQLQRTGPEDVRRFIVDYERISGRKLDYDNNMTGAFATIYDGSCRMEVVNDNSNLSGRFSITIRFESQYNDERYKSAIQTILQVFGMDSNDIHMLTDGFISDNSMRYTFDESYVSQHYHDKLRVSFESSQKRMGKVRPMIRGKIKITTYDYPAGRYITDKAE